MWVLGLRGMSRCILIAELRIAAFGLSIGPDWGLFTLDAERYSAISVEELRLPVVGTFGETLAIEFDKIIADGVSVALFADQVGLGGILRFSVEGRRPRILREDELRDMIQMGQHRSRATKFGPSAADFSGNNELAGVRAGRPRPCLLSSSALRFAKLRGRKRNVWRACGTLFAQGCAEEVRRFLAGTTDFADSFKRRVRADFGENTHFLKAGLLIELGWQWPRARIQDLSHRPRPAASRRQKKVLQVLPIFGNLDRSSVSAT